MNERKIPKGLPHPFVSYEYLVEFFLLPQYPEENVHIKIFAGQGAVYYI